MKKKYEVPDVEVIQLSNDATTASESDEYCYRDQRIDTDGDIIYFETCVWTNNTP